MKGKYQPKQHPYNSYENTGATAHGYEQWEIVYDGTSVNGLPCIGMIIWVNGDDTFRTNSNGNRCLQEISKCPDGIAAKALPFIEHDLLCYATKDGNVVGYHEAMKQLN